MNTKELLFLSLENPDGMTLADILSERKVISQITLRYPVEKKSHRKNHFSFFKTVALDKHIEKEFKSTNFGAVLNEKEDGVVVCKDTHKIIAFLRENPPLVSKGAPYFKESNGKKQLYIPAEYIQSLS